MPGEPSVWKIGYRAAVLANGATPYPLLDVLRILADSADHLHNEHNCDAHGWEVIAEARDAAREIIAEMTRVCGPELVDEGHGYGGHTALDAAREEGRHTGLEEAAKVCDDRAGTREAVAEEMHNAREYKDATTYRTYAAAERALAGTIRALATQEPK